MLVARARGKKNSFRGLLTKSTGVNGCNPGVRSTPLNSLSTGDDGVETGELLSGVGKDQWGSGWWGGLTLSVDLVAGIT